LALATTFGASLAVLINALADYTANSTRRFDMGVAAHTSGNIYGLAQCTPEMMTIDCRNYLSNLIEVKATPFSGKMGAKVIQIRCNFVFDDRKFFLGDPMVQLPEFAHPTVGERPGSQYII